METIFSKNNNSNNTNEDKIQQKFEHDIKYKCLDFDAIICFISDRNSKIDCNISICNNKLIIIKKEFLYYKLNYSDIITYGINKENNEITILYNINICNSNNSEYNFNCNINNKSDNCDEMIEGSNFIIIMPIKKENINKYFF